MNVSPRGLCLCLVLALSGCANLFPSSSSEPSADPVSPAVQSEIYYDMFADIPIPRAMSVDSSRTLVSTAENGMNIGLITVSGRVEIRSLNEAMLGNMTRHGWQLRGATTGQRTIQIYEKNNMFAVIYTYESTFSTIMEIWGAQRLNNVMHPGAAGGGLQFDPLAPLPAEEPKTY
jgi:hypothetical protein